MNTTQTKAAPDILGFSGPYRWLSNFEPCRVELDGVAYTTVEHAYVAAKTLDKGERAFIATLKRAGDAKKYGRGIILRDDWESVKIQVMTDLLVQKFSQEPFLSQLLATGDAYIEETNTWGDRFWGVSGGVGENHLGKILMEIRKLLRELDTAELDSSPEF